MILVTLGTQDKSFVRLLKALEEHLTAGRIQTPITVQSGYTTFKSEHMTIVPYFSQDALDHVRQEADIILTHGGVGSLLDGLRLQKVVVGVARLKRFKEHINDHQVEILEQFEREGYILWCRNLDELPDILKRAQNFKPKPYPFNPQALLRAIQSDIEDV